MQLKWPGPAFTAADVQALEAHFSVSLPSDYLHFLSLINGGVPIMNCYNYVHEDGEQGQTIVGHLDYMTTDYEDMGGIWKNTQALREDMEDAGQDRNNVVAIGRDGSIMLIYLDLSTPPPSVHILYLDDHFLACKIADSFEQFIDGLSQWQE